jgi:hypothetical protein
MLARPFWVIAGLTYASWTTAVVIFWAVPGFPISPLRLLVVVVLFYAPALWVGPWAANQGRSRAWTWREISLAAAVTCLVYAPLGILTFPAVPLTLGAVPTCLLLLAKGLVWLPKRAKPVAA